MASSSFSLVFLGFLCLASLRWQGVDSEDSTVIQIVSHGENVMINCYSDAGSVMNFWLRDVVDRSCVFGSCTDGVILPFVLNVTEEDVIPNVNGSLTLLNVNASAHGGDYSCLSMDDTSVNVSIHFLYFPPEEVNGRSSYDVNATITDDVVLTCSIEGFPSVSYQWERHLSDGTVQTLQGETQKELNISNVQFANAGTYRCIGSNEINGTMYEANLLLNLSVHSISPSGRVSTNATNPNLNQGDALEITCNGPGGRNASVQWLLDDTAITSGTDFTISSTINDVSITSTLNVGSVDAMKHKGEYTCSITNDQGMGLAQSTIVVSPIGITSIVPGNGQNIIANIGTNLSLECRTYAGPGTLFLWAFNATGGGICVENCGDNNIDYSDTEALKSVISNSSVLNISNINLDNAGNYTCITINDAGTEVATVAVLIHPEITQEPQDIAVSMNERASFNCTVIGLPSPGISWQRLVNGEFITLSGSEQTYTIDSVRYNDSGVYRCLAYTDVNNTRYEDTVNATLSVSPSGSATFVGDSDSTFKIAKHGDQFELTCQAQGGPNNTYQWLLNNEVIMEDDSLTITTESHDSTSNSILRISSFNATNHRGGNYTCRVMNSAGQDSITIPVIVSPEGTLSISPTTLVAMYGSSVSVTASTNTGPGNNFFWYFSPNFTTCVNDSVQCTSYGLSNHTLISTEAVLNLTNITSSSSGTYISAVTNNAGFEVAVRNLYLFPTFLQQPPQEVVGRINESALISIEVDGVPFPSIQWQKFTNGDFVNIPGETQSTLRFPSIAVTDGGDYRAVISFTIDENMYQATSNVSRITVPLKDTVSISGSSGLVAQGDQFMFTCTAQGGGLDINFRWLLDSVDITNSSLTNVTITSMSTSSTLTVGHVDASTHKGNYTCLASNGEEEETSSRVVIVSPAGVVMIDSSPSITDGGNVLIVSSGDNVTLSISTAAGPDNLYYWIRDTNYSTCVDDARDCIPFNANELLLDNLTVISNEPMLSLTNISGPQNGGRYFIVVLNEAGFEVITRNIYISPIFLQQPMDVVTRINESSSLSVSVDGSPFPTIQWYKLEQGNFSIIQDENEQVLSFDSIQPVNSGVYRCVLTANINGTEQTLTSRTVILSVALDGVVDISGSDGLVNQNEELVFSCIARGGPNNSYTWLKDGAVVTPTNTLTIDTVTSNGISNSTLRISSVDAAMHKGNYTCIVSNNAGQGTTSIVLTVSPVNITSIVPSQFVIATEGDSVVFNAQTDAGPDTEYTWRFQCPNETTSCNSNANVNGTTGVATLTSPVLRLSNVTVEENGREYTITISNEAGTETITSHVYFLPEILSQPSDINAQVNGSHSLVVAVRGFPRPTIQWQKSNGSTFEDISGENGTRLSFNVIEYSDAGSYRSVVSSTINGTVREVVSQTATITISLADTVEISGSSGLVKQGEELVIMCGAQGGPNNTYQWTKDGRPVMETNLLNITTVVNDGFSTSTLRISSINAEEHKGSYTCLVSNQLGSDNATLLVTVSPENIIDVMPSLTSVIAMPGDTVNFTAQTDAGPGTELFWFFDQSLSICVSEISDCTMNVLSLNATFITSNSSLILTDVNGTEDGGRYFVVAMNNAGFDAVIRNLYVLPQFLSQPQDIFSGLNTSDAFTVTIDGSPYPNIQWQKQLDNGVFVDIPGENGLTLEFQSIALNDSGAYRCVLSITVDNQTYPVMSRTAFLTVSLQDAATITTNVSRNVEQGDGFMMTCSAQGVVNVTYQWTLNGQPLMESGPLTITTQPQGASSVSILTINGVNASSHKGNYTCIVSNGIEEDSHSIVLVVSPKGIVNPIPEQRLLIGVIGSNITFEANTDAGPNNMYYWIFDPLFSFCVEDYSDCNRIYPDINITSSNLISTQPSLPLTDINGTNHGGQYYVVVINSAGHAVSGWSLFFLPSILGQPEDVVTMVNQSVNLTVVVDGAPSPTIQWQRLVNGVFENIPGENETVLHFDPVSYSNAGVYRSVVSNTINGTVQTTISREATILVSSEGTVMIQGTDGLVKEGEELTIACAAMGGPNNTYTWFHDGMIVTETNVLNITTVVSHTMSTSTLRISSVDAAVHKGNYTCSVMNGAGTETSSVLVVVSPEGIVDVSPMSTNIFGVPGDNITFIGETDAGPNTDYVWVFDPGFTLCVAGASDCDSGRVLNLSDYTILSYNLTLPLLNITGARNGGSYILSVLNDAGYELVTRNLYFTPRFIEQPQDVIADVNQSVSVSVVVDGAPYPTIQWQRLVEGVFVDIPGENTTTLGFSSVGYSNAGMYRVLLSTDINGTVYTQLSRETVIAVSLKDTATIEGTNGEVSQGGELVIICNAQGGPNNTYNWFHNGEPVMETGTLNITTVVDHTESSSTLRISSVDAATNKGNYTCMVSNRAGSDTTSVIVTVSPEGIVSTSPGNTTVKRGDTVTLECGTDAGPGTQYVWLYGITGSVYCNSTSSCYTSDTNRDVSSAILGSAETLTVSNITAPTKGGQYTCIVFNTAGSDESVSVINVEPEILSHPRSINVTNINQTYTLNCSIEGYPIPTVQWQKKDNTSGVFVNIEGENSASIEIETSNPVVTGIYRCAANATINGEDNIVYSTPATISIPLDGTVSVTPQTVVPLDYADMLVLNCTVGGGPDNVFEWYLNGTILTPTGSNFLSISTHEFYSTLVITRLSAPLHGGTFVCQTRNPISNDANGTTVFIKPRFLDEPAMIATAVNRTVQLRCEAESYPNPEYRWKRSSSSEYLVNGSSVLEFNPVTYEDNGYYTCIAESYGVAIESNSTTVYVSPFGSVKTTSDVFAESGDRVELNCSARGGPDNRFEWTYLSNGVVSNNSQYIINSVTPLVGGSYLCNVSNAAGHDTRVTVINVKADFIQQPDSLNVSIGDPIELQCAATARPSPNITWVHNGKQLTYQTDRVSLSSDSNTTTTNSSLRIMNTVLADSGLYYCVATNVHSDEFIPVNSSAVVVLVQDVPEAPYNFSSFNVSSRSLILRWATPDSRNSPILGYYVLFQHPSFLNGTSVVLSTDGAQDQMVLEELHPGTTYTFNVIAYNDQGNSSIELGDQQAYQVTTEEESPNAPPAILLGLAISSTEIFLRWTPPPEINRLGTISLYNIRYKGMDQNGTIVDPEKVVNETGTSIRLRNLEEYTVYEMSVRALTLAGAGPYYAPSLSISTNESLPSPVDPPTLVSRTNDSISVTWERPSDPNGVILAYLIQLSAVDFVSNPYSDRRRAINPELQKCFDHLDRNDTVITVYSKETTATVDNLMPYAMYEVRVAGITIIGPGNYSDPTMASTRQYAPGEIVNLRGIGKNSSAIVVGWEGPPCPNGVILGYRIYYSTHNLSNPFDDHDNPNFTLKEIYSSRRSGVVDITSGISQGNVYYLHIRAFSNYSSSGVALAQVAIEVNELIDRSFVPNLGRISTDPTSDRTINFDLPDISILVDQSNTSQLVFIGIIAQERKPGQPDFDPTTVNFDEEFQNLMPYKENADQAYYIAAGWNDLNEFPIRFTLGNGETTRATRLGVEETYKNAELKSETEYCYFVLTNSLFLGMEEEVVVRYLYIKCATTAAPTTPMWVILVPIFAIMLCCLCCVILLCCILCCCCRDRKKKKQLSDDDYQPLDEKPKEDSDRGSIAIINFPIYVKRMHENNDYPFSKEFENIEPKHNPSYTASLMNREKNRFSSLPAYDHSRVVLEKNPTNSDYINANYVDGYEDLGNFIATQGPLENTIGDFWWMIWEKRIPVIVMLTNLKEKGRVKSDCYWPKDDSSQETFGDISVTIESEAVLAHQTIRTFNIRSSAVSEDRRVTQYHFTSWPDHGVPKSTRDLLNLVEYVRSMYKPDLGPILVHCGTGVGRTGAFIALYVMLARLTRETTVDIYNYVQYMRRQRISMVSNETEYIFVHDALVDALRAGMIQGYILGLEDDTPQKITEKL